MHPQQMHPQQMHPQQMHPQQVHPQQVHPQQAHSMPVQHQHYQPQPHAHIQQSHQQIPPFHQQHQQQLQSHPPQVLQAHPMQSSHQAHLQQQAHPQHFPAQQPYPQHVFPQQSQPQHSQAQLTAQHAAPPQVMLPPQQTQQPSPWEHSQQHLPAGWVQEGHPNMMQGAAGHDSTPQYGQLHQQPQHQWQGKPAGHAVHSVQSHGLPQPMQARPHVHLQVSSQNMRPGVMQGPASQTAAHVAPSSVQGIQTPKQGPVAPSIGTSGPPRNQQVQHAQPAQGSEAQEKIPSTVPHTQPAPQGQADAKNIQDVNDVDFVENLKPPGTNSSDNADQPAAITSEKGENQSEEKMNLQSPQHGDVKSAPVTELKDSNVSDGEQEPPGDKALQPESKEEKPEIKEGSTQQAPVTQSSTKSAQGQSPTSGSKALQNASAAHQESTPAQASQSPHVAQMSNASQMQQKEVLPLLQQKQPSVQIQNTPLLQRSPLPPAGRGSHTSTQPSPVLVQGGPTPVIQQKMPQMNALPHFQHHPSPLQSLMPRPGMHPSGQRRVMEPQLPHVQEPLLPALPQMAGTPRLQVPAQSQPVTNPFFPGSNQPLQGAPRPPPAEPMFGVPQPMGARPGMYHEQRPPFSGQTQQLHGFSQGLSRDQPANWRPGGLSSIFKEPQSPTHVSSPLTPPLLMGGPQRGYPEFSNQYYMPPPPQAEAARPMSVDQNRHLMEQIAAFENETKSGKSFESDKYGAGPDESYLLEAQKRFNQRPGFRPELPPQHSGFLERSPPRPLDLGPRFPPTGPTEMPPRGPPHLPLEMEIRARTGISTDTPSDRELFPRSSFLPDAAGGREYSSDFGLSSRKVSEFRGHHSTLDAIGLRSGIPSDAQLHLKYPPDPFLRARSPEFGPRSSGLPDIGTHRTPPRPPFSLESESRSKFHMDMDSRPPFQVDMEPRPKLGDIDSRPSMLLDNEGRYKLPSDTEFSRPSFHLDSFRPRFTPDIECPGLHVDVDQRTKFTMDGESRPRFDSEMDSRRNFDFRSGSSFEDRSRIGFPSEVGLPGRIPHSDMMSGRQEGSGISADFLGPRGDSIRSRADSISSIRSPGRESLPLPPYRRDAFGSGWREPASLPSHFESLHGGPPLHSGPDFGRDAFRFEDPRFKGLDAHPGHPLHDPINQIRQFQSAERGHFKGGPGPGPGFPHGFAGQRPPIGSMNGGPQFKPAPFTEDLDSSDFGRKRKQAGSSGWCRICHIDCYTVQGLEEHSKSEDHQKKTLDLVMSIKQDSAKKLKQSDLPEAPKESPKRTPTQQEKSMKPADDDDDDEDDDGSESE
ncbi:hypothetical protein KP509_08G054400 [Ceratopteris richardii]|uniref:Uncharacterized protein n=1 Tax=Ceratopteris richardii TaxID=49495 RepID=A0A8T2UGH7_CERRI|nr:hypothetical protein KP509_08G054400 [Ceratopteris richardii]